jgi:WD40 repeat protein
MRGDLVDGQTDIWAVGIMLHVLAIGSHPLGTPKEPPSLEDLVTVTDLTVPMSSVRIGHPELGRLAAIIDRCLVKRKEDRTGSARELLGELEEMLPNRPRPADDSSPYPGLAAFQTRDATRFFGRDRLVSQAVSRLSELPLLAVLGPSGAGKSSFVRAGLLPALNHGDDAWQALVLRPGPYPLTALAELLLRHVLHDSADGSGMRLAMELESSAGYRSREVLAQRLKAEPGHLGWLLRTRARRRRERILLFCDQFEEVFTLASGNERAALFACICGAVDDALSPVRVVVAMRSDFLDRLADAPALAEFVGRGVFLLGPMNRDELRTALVEPVRQADHDFESEAMVTEMLDALAGTPAALPLLQFTAARLWDNRDRQRRLLTLASYRAMGGVAGALASHADAVLASMSSTEKRAARAVLLRLVTTERTRAIVPLSELTEQFSSLGAHVEGVVERLVDARLLAIETGDGRQDKMVEIVHESLLDRWEKLRTWIEEEQHDARFLAELRSAAAQWESNGRAEGFLWREEAARRAQAWVVERNAAGKAPIGAKERGYLQAVLSLAERTRKLRRRIVACVFSVTVLITIVVTILAIAARRQASVAMHEMYRADEQAKRAEEQAKLAQEEARLARNATRMAAASSEIQNDSTMVLALLREIEPGPAPKGWSSLVTWARDAGVAQRVLPHDADVNRAAFSPNGKYIVSAAGKNVHVWNERDGTSRIIGQHESEVFWVAYSPDGQRIVSASTDKTVRVWRADGQGEPIVLRGHEDVVASAMFSPDGQHIVSASYDTTVRVWNANGTGEPLVLKGHRQRVTCASYSPDGQHIVSGSTDKTVRVWNADGTGKPLVLEGHEGSVNGAVFSPDGKRIGSSAGDKTVRVWNANGKGAPLVLKGHDDSVWSVAFTPDGQRLISASADQTIRVWNADGKGAQLVLKAHRGSVYDAEISSDSRRLVSASADQTVRVWDLASLGRVITLRGHRKPVRAAAYSPDGQHIVSASFDNTLRIWNADGTGDPLVLEGQEAFDDAVYSPDGRRIVSAGLATWNVWIWNADGKGKPIVLRGHRDSVHNVRFSPDGQRIVSASRDKTVRVWSADGKGEPLVLRGHEAIVYMASFSPDSQRIVSASADKTIRIWRADGEGEPLVLRGHEGDVLSAVFSPDGEHIVSTSSADGTVRVWRADGQGESVVLSRHKSQVAVNGDRPFSPDGKRFVFSSDDGTVQIWNIDGSGEPVVLRGSGARPSTASFSPDGKRIVAALNDNTILIWTDVEPLKDASDPRLWTATRDCMPLDVRESLLGFSEAQSQSDLERCQKRVNETAQMQP